MSEQDFEKLHDYLDKNMDTPKGLKQKVFFDVLFQYGRRGREGLRELRKYSFVFLRDGEGSE